MAKQGFRVIDSDLHVIEPPNLWTDYLDPEFRGRVTTGPGTADLRAHVDGHVLPPYADRPERQRAWSFRLRHPESERIRRATQPEAAVQAMDVEGIDIGIVFRTWATQGINIDGLDPALAAALCDHLAKRYLDNLVLSHAVGQPVEMMLTLGAVVTGGVLSRFPRLRMAFLEGNCAWLPWWLWALDERWEKRGDQELFQQDAKPSELFRRQCFISVEPEEELAKYVVAELGDDNLVLSTDWPHDDSRFPHSIDGFLALPHLSADTKRKILWDNCARLYKL